MFNRFKRHPLAIRAFFRHCLVLTYAFPREILEPLLPPALTLDTYEDLGFVAVAHGTTYPIVQGIDPVPALSPGRPRRVSQAAW